MRAHATGPQRLGMVLAFLQACAFALATAVHLNIPIHLGDRTIDDTINLSAAIIEGLLALSLVVAVVLPASGPIRAGRVMAAEVLAVIGVLASQVALAFGLALRTRTLDLFHVAMLAVSIAAMLLVARRRVVVERPVVAAAPTAPVPEAGQAKTVHAVPVEPLPLSR